MNEQLLRLLAMAAIGFLAYVFVKVSRHNEAAAKRRADEERRDANARAAFPALNMDWQRTCSLVGKDYFNTQPDIRSTCKAAYIVADEMEITRDL